MALKSQKRILAVLAISLIQYLLAFYAWSFVPGNAAPGTGAGSARIVWYVMKFPMFYLFPDELLFFNTFFIADAVIWGVTLGWILPVFCRQRPASEA
jgi:hypothetical protein